MTLHPHRLSGQTLRPTALGVNTFGTHMTPEQGARLRAFLEHATGGRHGWVTDLATAAHVRRQTVYDWFSGKGAPSLESLDAIATALDVKRYEIVAAMDGDAPVMELDSRMKEYVTQELERLIAARADVPPPRKPRARGAGG